MGLKHVASAAVIVGYLLTVAGSALVFLHPSFLSLIVAGAGLAVFGIDELRSR